MQLGCMASSLNRQGDPFGFERIPIDDLWRGGERFIFEIRGRMFQEGEAKPPDRADRFARSTGQGAMKFT